MDIKISIIMPVYNAEKYLSETIKSVQKQSFREFELIAINDGSNDRSLDILKSYAENDNRIIIIDQNNCGVSKSRNKGISIARGEYISFLDADDLLEKDFLKSLIMLSKRNNADIVITGYEIFYRAIPTIKKYKSNIHYDSNINLANIFKSDLFTYLFDNGLAINIWNKLFRTSFIKMNGISFSEMQTFDEDMFFTWKCILIAKGVYLDNQCRYFYRLSNSSTIMKYHDKVYEQYITAFNELKEFANNKGLNTSLLENNISQVFANKISVLLFMVVRSRGSFFKKPKQLRYYLNNSLIQNGISILQARGQNSMTYKLASTKKFNKLLVWGYLFNFKMKFARVLKPIFK